MTKVKSRRERQVRAVALNIERDLGDDGDLTLAERGAKIRLLVASRASGSLPVDERALFHLARAVTEAEQDAVRRMVRRYFILNETGRLVPTERGRP
jgi:uncharacterized protein YdaU (DUF1376 family)